MHFFSDYYDLTTPDGAIQTIELLGPKEALATVVIENISLSFVGHQIPKEMLCFNFKSTLAQLGLDGIGEEIELDPRNYRAIIRVRIRAIGPLAQQLLPLLTQGAYI